MTMVSSIEEIWRRYDATESRLTAALSERMLDLAGLQPGMRVLDLATGRGEPALRAAQRVGLSGQVLGVDLSESMLRMAREQAERQLLANLELRVANAEALDDLLPGHFDAVTARWGLMYMGDPVAALVNVRRALSSSGVLVAALWAEPARCAFYALPTRLLQRYRSVPAPVPERPGTFRYANLEHLERDLSRAGLMLDHVEEMDVTVFEAGTGAELVAWVRALGSGVSQLLNDLSDTDQRAWESDFIAETEPHRAGGLVRLRGVTRIVRAHPA